MIDFSTLRKETRYGMPAADQILFNRHYVTGYSYYFRQPKWTLEIVNPPVVSQNAEYVERSDNFRSDFRVPQLFRADLVDFRDSGFDRGHLVSSANQRDEELQNSETFLLSNMSPQQPKLNRRIWKDLETAVRELNNQEDVLETFVATGPAFNFDMPVEVIGGNDSNDVSIPVPHMFFKSILTENKKGNLHMWSFMIPNEETDDDLEEFQVTTRKIEQWAGILLWDRLVGTEIEIEKTKIRPMWDF